MIAICTPILVYIVQAERGALFTQCSRGPLFTQCSRGPLFTQCGGPYSPSVHAVKKNNLLYVNLVVCGSMRNMY